MLPRFHAFFDKLHITFNGGVRIRISNDGARRVTILGKVSGTPPERLSIIVQELSPQATGTVDFQHDGRGNWRVRARGTFEDRFEQRLRNVIVNR